MRAFFVLFLVGASVLQVQAASPDPAPRIESVVMADVQPHTTDSAVIWYDNFDDPSNQKQYGEQSGKLTETEHFGAAGRSLEMGYPKGSRGVGGRKIFFGDSPTSRGKVVRGNESFDEIYWRIYVKHPADWQGGGPAKLSRATSLVPPGWRQAMISHVWSQGEALTLDPATGVRNGEVVTQRYNDFPNLKWLGNRPASNFKLHGSDGLGRWVSVEARVKLNTPGQKDGENQLWIDGRLEAERHNLDWRGTFTERGINAVFLEAYWNEGSPVDQARWIDNFVVSTQPIGPVVCPRNPELIRAQDVNASKTWQVELASDESGDNVVWQSSATDNPERMIVSSDTGQFVGKLVGKKELGADEIYFCRARQLENSGKWTAWSDWHQPFRTTPD